MGMKINHSFLMELLPAINQIKNWLLVSLQTYDEFKFYPLISPMLSYAPSHLSERVKHLVFSFRIVSLFCFRYPKLNISTLFRLFKQWWQNKSIKDIEWIWKHIKQKNIYEEWKKINRTSILYTNWDFDIIYLLNVTCLGNRLLLISTITWLADWLTDLSIL